MEEAIDPDGQSTKTPSFSARSAENPFRKARHWTEIPLWRDVTDEQWADYRWHLKNSVTSLEQLEQVINLTPEEREGYLATRSEFAMSITPYLCTLMDPDDPTCPVRMQFAPRVQEIGGLGYRDSLGEDAHRVAPGLVHRYPDRVLFLVNNMCASYCRFCTRKRLTGLDNEVLPKAEIEQTLAYLRAHPEVRDVLISGGDPLTMSDRNLEYVVSKLREIPSIEIIRIGTKMPMFLPMRVTDDLVKMLSKYHPLWINTHFNHPKELTPEAKAAVAKIVNAGIPLGNQSVLLRGVNSSARIMKELMHELVKNRVRPYYIYQCDLEDGLEHFRTPVEKGIEIMEELRGWTTGFAVPTYVIDSPGGGGKIPVAPNYMLTLGESRVMIRNFEGETFSYPQPAQRDCTVGYEKKWFGEVPVATAEAAQQAANASTVPTAHASARPNGRKTKLRVIDSASA
ncbi:KamA family radical SAM protein [Myxococcota bacterium]|nr:KamA family radical SAM protein [Myxococcota bacterium]